MSAERDSLIAGLVTLLFLVAGWMVVTAGLAALCSPKVWLLSVGLLLFLFGGVGPFVELVMRGFASLLVEPTKRRR